MTYTSLERTRQQTDLLATDLLPECPGCNELCPAGATVCAECGSHLFVRTATAPERASLDGPRAQGQKEAIMAVPTGCSCGGRGLCTVCVLAEYDNDPFVRSTEIALEAVSRPANVVALPGYSKRVTS